jgi:NO-binding membrane sensor protein with MHYT domain
VLVTVVVGLAVPLMHYTGMLASQFDVSEQAKNSLANVTDGVLSLDLFLLFALVTVVVPLLANAVIPSATEDFQAQLEA